jgi:hypothetical protein
LFDADDSKDYHKKINDLIESSRNKATYKIKMLSTDIEDFMGIEKAKRQDRKPQHMMLKLKEGVIPSDKINSFIDLIKGLIKYD